jgi:molecular chaperone DnaK
VPQSAVTLGIALNGILNVTARDQGTGKEQNIEIKSDSGLSEDEIEQMRHEAEEHAEEDKERRELAEIRNRADQLAYSTEQSLEEHKEKLPDEDVQKIQTALDDLQEVLDSEDKEQIEQKMEALQSASYKLGEMVYESTKAQQAGGPAEDAQPGAGEPEGGGEEEEEVVDADYEVKE